MSEPAWASKSQRDSRRYGRAHRRLRASWALKVATGHVACWRCGELINPRAGFDLGHDDADPARYRGPEHRECNRATQSPERKDPQPAIREWWAS